jgi:lambda family phage portal protein
MATTCDVTDDAIADEYRYSQSINRPAFEGASTNYRNAHREAIVGDADALAVGEYLFLQSRCHYMVRNNPIASAARDKTVTSGGCLTVKWQKPDGSKHTLMDELWEEVFYGTGDASINYDGKGDGDTLQAINRHERFTSGEALNRMLIQRSGNPNRIPLKLQGINSEYLDISYNGMNGAEQLFTRYGITFDKVTNSKPTVYNFLDDQYFSIQPRSNSFERVKVPAKNILHIFERKRQGQWRGVPFLASVLIPLYEIEDLCTATVRTQTEASAVSWIVHKVPNAVSSDAVGAVTFGGRLSPKDTTKQLAFATSGGTVQYVDNGGELQLVQSRDIGQNLVALLKEEYQKIAAALSIPYYKLTGDTSGLDFSSLRGILTEQRQRLEFEYNIIDVPDFFAPLCKRFKELALALNYDVTEAVPVFHNPRWYGVDDLKDFQAYLLAVASGFMPLQAVWELLGYDEEKIQQSMGMLKKLGLENLINTGSQNPAQNNQQPTMRTTGS